MFGAGGGTSSYEEIEETDLIILWGSNARETHPIFFHHLLKGVHNGAKLYVVDPRRTVSAQWADRWLGLDVGTDIALAHAVGREIISTGLTNEEFVRNATSRFEDYKAQVEPFTLENAEKITGVPGEAIRELAHAYAKARRASLCWTTRHHRAPQRRRHRAGADQPVSADRPCGAIWLGIESFARAEQCAGRRRYGCAA